MRCRIGDLHSSKSETNLIESQPIHVDRRCTLLNDKKPYNLSRPLCMSERVLHCVLYVNWMFSLCSSCMILKKRQCEWSNVVNFNLCSISTIWNIVIQFRSFFTRFSSTAMSKLQIGHIWKAEPMRHGKKQFLSHWHYSVKVNTFVNQTRLPAWVLALYNTWSNVNDNPPHNCVARIEWWIWSLHS